MCTAVAVGALLTAHFACIGAGDSFFTTRRLVGKYSLERADGAYYITVDAQEPSRSMEPGGVLHGAIEQLGWNQTHIVAAVTRGGWRIIDVPEQTISGVLSEEETLQQLKTKPELKAIRMHRAEDAWKMLRMFQ